MIRLPRWLRRPEWSTVYLTALRELHGTGDLTVDTIVGAPRPGRYDRYSPNIADHLERDGLDDDERIVVGVLTTLEEGLHQPGDLARLIVAALRRGHP